MAETYCGERALNAAHFTTSQIGSLAAFVRSRWLILVSSTAGTSDRRSLARMVGNTEPNPRPLSESNGNRSRVCPYFLAIVLFPSRVFSAECAIPPACSIRFSMRRGALPASDSRIEIDWLPQYV